MENTEDESGKTSFSKLRRFNLVMGFFHFIQAVMMLILSLTWSKIISFTPQISGSFLVWNETTQSLSNSVE